MHKNTLELSENKAYRLRAIQVGDLENLRLWKNIHKAAFFHKKDISEQEQFKWFESFQNRPADHMLMVEVSTKEGPVSVGCMGYRLKDDHIDVYNVMRGYFKRWPDFSMGMALRLLVDYAIRTENLPVRCIVLKGNPAIDWYLRNRFEVRGDDSNFVTLEFITEGKLISPA
jgi:hypothetical protein